jgi:hypothetical protein
MKKNRECIKIIKIFLFMIFILCIFIFLSEYQKVTNKIALYAPIKLFLKKDIYKKKRQNHIKYH